MAPLAALLLVAGCGKQEGAAPAQGGPPAMVFPVTAGEITQDSITRLAPLVGSIRYVRRIRLKAETRGTVKLVAFQEGQRFKKGDVLVRLDDSDYLVDLAMEQAALDRAQRHLEDLKAGTRQEVIDRLAAAVSEAEAKVMQANDELKRTQKLYDEHVRTEAELIRAKATAASNAAQLAQTKASLAEARSGTRPEEIRVAEADVHVQEARVKSVQHDLAKTEIRAPFDGVVLERLTEIGTYLDEGKDLLDIASTNDIIARLEVPERFIIHVQPGTAFDLRADALPGKTFPCKVDTVIPLADDKSRNIYVRATIGGASTELVPGMFVRAEVPVATRDKAILAPIDAVTLRDGKPIIYRIKDDMTAELLPVTTGISSDSRIEIVSPALTPGDKVVTTGGEVLFPGAKLMLPNAAPPAPAHP